MKLHNLPRIISIVRTTNWTWSLLHEDLLYYITYNRVNHEIRAVDRWSQANFQGRFYWWAILTSDVSGRRSNIKVDKYQIATQNKSQKLTKKIVRVNYSILNVSALDFWNYQVWNIEYDELDFWSISNWNFTGYSRKKNPVQTRKKNPVIKLNISNWRIAKIKIR